MTETVRLFIAIPLPERAKSALVSVGEQLNRRFPPRVVRWVRPFQLHLTLRFLGETAVAAIPALQDELTALTADHSALNLHLSGIGAFPNQKRARVIWAGLSGDKAALLNLKSDLDSRLVKLGWSVEKRPFSPHITLGRVKDVRQMKGVNWAVDLLEEAVPVTAVHLIQSDLRPSGPNYTLLHLARLTAG